MPEKDSRCAASRVSTERSDESFPGPLTAVVSSRLGRDRRVHHRIAAFLHRSGRDVRRSKGAWVIAIGSAIEPWARRAAEIYQVPAMYLVCPSARKNQVPASADVPATFCHANKELNRDQAVIDLADRIDALKVRSNGRIHRLLRREIDVRDRARDRHVIVRKKDGNADAVEKSIRVGVWPERSCASGDLIAAGALGWHLLDSASENRHDAGVDDSISKTVSNGSLVVSNLPQGDWLVHWTRGVSGPWPGETENQYRDELLLSRSGNGIRSPLDTLLRILRSGRLLASAVTSRHDCPVVCLSERPLKEILSSRVFRPQVGRWDAEPYGVMIRREAAERCGARPVIYGDPKVRNQIDAVQRYRFQAIGRTVDWRTECEWRFSGNLDLTRVPAGDLRVFAWDDPEARSRLCRFPYGVVWVSGLATRSPIVSG